MKTLVKADIKESIFNLYMSQSLAASVSFYSFTGTKLS